MSTDKSFNTNDLRIGKLGKSLYIRSNDFPNPHKAVFP